MSQSLIPNSTNLAELTRVFRIIEAQIRGLGGNASQGAVAERGGGVSPRFANLTLPPPSDPSSADLTAIYERLVTIETVLPTKAPLDSPAFTGTPTAPTAPPGTSTDQIATCAFVPPPPPSYFPSGW